jgi:D-aminopeptidase
MPLNRRELLQIGPLALAGWKGGTPAAGISGRRRARELGVRIGRLEPGPWNAITDVPGVTVGQVTLVAGEGALEVGRGPVRTGVTAIWPHAGIRDELLPCGFDMPNANGELTGLIQAARLGVLGSPICFTNTSSVGMAYDALLAHLPEDDLPPLEPFVGETWDAFLNDIEGRHVRAEHVAAALARAQGGAVAEGCVGGGTGMVCYGFKGGIGTASRQLPAPFAGHTVGVLVQANHGVRELLRIDGVPVGEEVSDLRPDPEEAAAFNSILMLVATDVPLFDYQLDRLARRAVHGLAKTGSISSNSSGDFTLAFSTANRIPRRQFWAGDSYPLRGIDQYEIAPLFEAAAEATEEAIVNALFMATDMVGRDGHRVFALPLERTLEIMARHGRLFPADEAERGVSA